MTALDDLLLDSRDLPNTASHNREDGLWTTSFPITDTFEGEISDPRTLHKYVYAADNPITFSDPSGRFFGLAIGFVSVLAAQAITGFVRVRYDAGVLAAGAKALSVFGFAIAGGVFGAFIENQQAAPMVFERRKSGAMIRHFSVTAEDLRTDLNDAINQGDPIDLFVLLAHGGPTGQLLEGTPKVFTAEHGQIRARPRLAELFPGQPNPQPPVQLPAGGIDLTPLFLQALAPDARVYLTGCETAQGNDNLAHRISTILPGRKVQGQNGGEWYIGWFTMTNLWGTRTYLNGVEQ